MASAYKRIWSLLSRPASLKIRIYQHMGIFYNGRRMHIMILELGVMFNLEILRKGNKSWCMTLSGFGLARGYI